MTKAAVREVAVVKWGGKQGKRSNVAGKKRFQTNEDTRCNHEVYFAIVQKKDKNSFDGRRHAQWNICVWQNEFSLRRLSALSLSFSLVETGAMLGFLKYKLQDTQTWTLTYRAGRLSGWQQQSPSLNHSKDGASCLPSQTEICWGLCFSFTTLMKW